MKINFEIESMLKTLLTISLLFFIIILGKELIYQDSMFSFHDMTQYARIDQYSKSIIALQIPPYFAKEMNFGLGYPIFLFYAPLAYIVGSIFHLLGVPTIESVRLSFLVFWMIGIISMYLWLKLKYKNTFSALIGAVLYGSSPWWASEIFVRGNLATTSFLAFAPLALWASHNYKKTPFRSTLAISLSIISHNALSLIFAPILLLYGHFLSRDDRKRRLIFISASIFTSLWFWLPSMMQLSQTYAQEVATMISYKDHFLCLSQIWTTGFWGYGASLPGCNDGMSFMLGKLQIILFLIGSVLVFFKTKYKSLQLTEMLIVVVLIFMTLPDSVAIWASLTPLHSLQFPWRLSAIAMIFTISIGSYALVNLFDYISNLKWTKWEDSFAVHFPRKYIAYIISIIFICTFGISSMKFFTGQKVEKKTIERQFLSKSYISNLAAYEAPEYLPRVVDRNFWLKFRNQNISVENRELIKNQIKKFHPSIAYLLIGFILSILALLFNIWPLTKKHH